jgi:hypothetical protein
MKIEMKNMKINYHTGLTMLLLFFIVACKKEPMPYKPEPSAFMVEAKGPLTALPAAGGKLDVVVNANSNGWWIVLPEESKTWCKPGKYFGSGNQTISITLLPNPSNVARKTELLIKPTFNLEPVKLVIEQLPK